MFDLFKFVMLRTSKEVDGNTIITINLDGTKFGADLNAALKDKEPPESN